MTPSIELINQAVTQQYDIFPYPNYGLFLPLRWQEAYASHSSFAHGLLNHIQNTAAFRPKGEVLIAGCGDVFPSILAHWEHRTLPIHAIDISRTNLMRAKFRCLTQLQRCFFHQLNLDSSLPFQDSSFSHIDAYGVLHHLANPRASLAELARVLAPGGTIRLMVYNRQARDWIHQLQKIFALLHLSPFEKKDRQDSLRLLEAIARECPALRERLLTILPQLRSKPTRLVDTFLHAREARIDLENWLESFPLQELQVLGLFDRYAELDDLPNPLYHFPSLAQLNERCLDRRFENNWELYLTKDSPNSRSIPLQTARMIDWRSAPIQWFQYQETQHIPRAIKRELWKCHLSYYSPSPLKLSSESIDRLEESALQRLLRIGALWPSALPSAMTDYLLKTPLHSAMEPPHLHKATPFIKMMSCTRILQSILLRKKRNPKVLQLIAKRLEIAQK